MSLDKLCLISVICAHMKLIKLIISDSAYSKALELACVHSVPVEAYLSSEIEDLLDQRSQTLSRRTLNDSKPLDSSPVKCFTSSARSINRMPTKARSSTSQDYKGPKIHEDDYDRLRKSSTSISALRGETVARLPSAALWISPERHPSNTAGFI